jgi:hypothetical protein
MAVTRPPKFYASPFEYVRGLLLRTVKDIGL